MKVVAVLLAAALAAGCSGLKTYSSDAPKNLRVATHLERGVRTSLHVHEVTGPCQTRYEGTVALDQPTVEVGVPEGRQSFVVVGFDTSSFLGGQRGTTVGTVLAPRAGYRYELAVRYKQDIYDVALREVDRKGVARELPRRGLSGC
jgi:hypothetical protein